MSPILRKNTVSTAHTGNLVIEADRNRGYFFIVAQGDLTMEFGGGGGEIPLKEGQHYCPYVCPIGEIKVNSGNSYVIHMG
jgi:hypothetical protein